jgi:pimeloyl-ACP methyl ester carboxylesterase
VNSGTLVGADSLYAASCTADNGAEIHPSSLYRYTAPAAGTLHLELTDGANFSRARLGIEGMAFGQFEYNFLYDFGGSGTEEAGKISPAWVQYNVPGKPVRIRAGAFSPPAGIEEAKYLLVTVPDVGHTPNLEEPESHGAIDRLLKRVLAR